MTRRFLGPSRSALRVGVLGAALACDILQAKAREIHLVCARTEQSVSVDIDTDRRFMQLMWSEGVAEEYQDGELYISGPDSSGRKEKVVYTLNVDKNLVSFGQDRLCQADGSKGKCVDQHIHNTLDVSRGEMKYADGDTIMVLQCIPAPPGRRF